jgi:glucose-6-phosphate 1-dehydrogenase
MDKPAIRVEAPTEPMIRARKPNPCTIVIFGATGDLSKRKLIPALYNLARDQGMPDSFSIIGFSRSVPDEHRFRTELREAVEEFSRTQPIDEEVWSRFESSIFTVPGSFTNLDSFRELKQRMDQLDEARGTQGNRLFYLSTLPSFFPMILESLKNADLLHPAGAPEHQPWSRVVIEKPFGRDLESAIELNRLAGEVLDERQIFRIDHYMGKETVRNILVFRFGNSIFEPVWNHKYIDYVEVTMAEELGVDGRGDFYDQTGVVRDIVQNHLLEVLTLCAMEPPISFAADDLRDEKYKVLRSLRPITSMDLEQNAVFGQYRGYRDQEGVSSESRTPTFAALKVMVDNWRWQGVPFYMRAGKKLPAKTTEVVIHFHPIPFCLFGREEVCQMLKPNVLRLRLQPNEGIELCFASKVPGEDLSIAEVTMDFSYAKAFKKSPPEAYERLLQDAMRGDAMLFLRRDAVEEAWNFVTPILKAWEEEASMQPQEYAPGSEGPEDAMRMLWSDGHHWRQLANR